MKRILIVLFACLLAAGVLFGIAGITATNLFASGGLRGSGNIVTKRIEAPDFAAIDASRAVKVIVTDALTDEIVIEADDNVMEKVLVESRRGTLFVGIDKSVRRISDHSVTVRVPANGEIRALDASSAAQIICETALEAYEFLIDVSSAAQIEVALKATQCRIDVSSAGELVAALEADSCTADLSSAAKARLSGRSRWCEVDVSSAANFDAGVWSSPTAWSTLRAALRPTCTAPTRSGPRLRAVRTSPTAESARWRRSTRAAAAYIPLIVNPLRP